MSLKGIFSNDVYLAKTGLGKFIILAVCLLHYGWAILLMVDPKSMGVTPLAGILYIVGYNLYLAELVLIAFSTLAIWYLSLKEGAAIPAGRYAIMLIPQLWLLCMSAGSGLLAASKGYYLDAVTQPGLFIIVQRPRAFILADELPIIVMALLYLTAVIFTSRTKVRWEPFLQP